MAAACRAPTPQTSSDQSPMTSEAMARTQQPRGNQKLCKNEIRKRNPDSKRTMDEWMILTQRKGGLFILFFVEARWSAKTSPPPFLPPLLTPTRRGWAGGQPVGRRAQPRALSSSAAPCPARPPGGGSAAPVAQAGPGRFRGATRRAVCTCVCVEKGGGGGERVDSVYTVDKDAGQRVSDAQLSRA